MQEYEPWRDADQEERRRSALANSTGSQSIDRRIAMNRDRARRAQDKRRAIIADMRSVIQGALGGKDEPPTSPGGPHQGAAASITAFWNPRPHRQTRAAHQTGWRMTPSSARAAGC